MSEFEEFYSRGTGFGLPFATKCIDVSGYDYWTTFSGVNKNNPETSVEKITDSLILGNQFAWRFFSISFSQTATYSGTGNPESISNTFLSVNDDTYSNLSREKPFQRVCGNYSGSKFIDAGGINVPNQCIMRAGIITNTVRLFNGPIDEEDNFVGFGIDSFSVSFWSRSASQTEANISLSSFFNESSPGTNEVLDYDYVSVSGINFVCSAKGEGRTTRSADASGLTASGTSLQDVGGGITETRTTNVNLSASVITFYDNED